jgi:hypothetical protein
MQRIEWGFTLLFTVEYLLRIWIAHNRRAYVLSVPTASSTCCRSCRATSRC